MNFVTIELFDRPDYSQKFVFLVFVKISKGGEIMIDNNGENELSSNVKNIFDKEEANICSFMFKNNKSLKISNIDDLLDIKWNVMKLICKQKMQNNQYQQFFENENNRAYVNSFAFSSNTFASYFLLSIGERLENNSSNVAKIEVNNIVSQLQDDNNNNEVELPEDSNLIKVFRAICLFTQDGFHLNDVFASNRFMRALLKAFFGENKEQDFIFLLNHINKIKCDDKTFQGFQSALSGFYVKIDGEKFCFMKKDDKSNSEEAQNPVATYTPPGNENSYEMCESDSPDTERKLSLKKTFLFILNVLISVALIFYVVNLIFPLFFLETFLIILLGTFAFLAFIISSLTNIKYDVINLPQCLGGNKSFIDIYEDIPNMEKGKEKDEVEINEEED